MGGDGQGRLRLVSEVGEALGWEEMAKDGYAW